MVTINLYLLLALLQALLIVTVVLAIWIWRLGRVRSRMLRAETQLGHLQGKQSATDYLQAEIDANQNVQLEGEDASWRDVRITYLQFELQHAERSDTSVRPDLEVLRRKLGSLLQANEAPAAATQEREPVEVDEENIDFPEMLQRQQQLLDALKTQVHGAISNQVDLQRCDEKLGMLDLVGRELETCTLMMEEENNFLRDQIRALLAGPEPDASASDAEQTDPPDAADPDDAPEPSST